MLVPLTVLLVAFALVVVGVALLSTPAAFITAGVCLALFALLVDFDRKGEGS